MASSTDTGSVFAETEVAHSGPSLLHGRRAKAIAALSSHESTTAIWLIGFTGEPCGAWILDTTTKEQAQTALGILDRRAIIETLQGSAGTTLQELAEMAGIRIPEASTRFASLADLHEATKTARATYEKAATAHGQVTKTRLTSLAWPTPLPTTLEDDSPRASRLWSGDGSATEAFVAAATARRLIRMWNKTESLRVRRAYLREKYGDAQLLPQVWREAAFAAYEAPLTELPAIPPPPKD